MFCGRFEEKLTKNIPKKTIMKRKNFFQKVSSLFMAVVMVAAVACDGPEPDGGEPTPDDGKEEVEENEDFIISVDNLTAGSVSITVTPPTYEPEYFACLYPDTATSLGSDDAALLDGILSSSTLKYYVNEGQQTFEYQGLIGNSHYRLVYFSYNKTSGQVLSDLYRSERITTPAGEKMFDITVSNISGMAADVKIEPKDASMSYYYYLDEMDDYVNSRHNSDYELVQFDFAYWKEMASMNNSSVSALIGESLRTGTVETNSYRELELMEWDTDYYVYAYGLDVNGNLLSHVTKEVFHTPAPAKSDMTFEIGEPTFEYYFDQQEGYGATRGWKAAVTVTPSNPDEKYFVTITNTSWYDWFFGSYNKGRSDYKYLQLQVLSNANKSAGELLSVYKQGEFTYEPYEERKQLLKPNYDYVVLVFGVDENGATTEVITTKYFKTSAFPQE